MLPRQAKGCVHWFKPKQDQKQQAEKAKSKVKKINMEVHSFKQTQSAGDTYS